jgi:hypothetical protein
MRIGSTAPHAPRSMLGGRSKCAWLLLRRRRERRL